MDRQNKEFVNNYSLEEIMPILSKLVRRYTSGDSSSVPYETGEMLMTAIRYTINQINGEGIIKGELPASEAYELGHKLLIEKVENTLNMYDDIMESFDDYGSVAYYDTMVRGMPEFFKWYDVDFCPQDTILLLDYPLEEPINGLCGINMIKAYLEEIEKEQQFLRKFPPGFVAASLEEYHFLGKELIINLTYVLKSMAE